MVITKSILIGAIAVSVCIAQSVNISGKVTDTGGTPLPGAVVRLEKGGQTATTGADGNFTLANVSVHGQNNQLLSHKLSAAIHNGILCVNVQEKSDVEITTFSLQGKAISTVQKTMEAGNHSLALPNMGAGIYLYKVKAGNKELLIKSHSFGGVSGGTAVFIQGSSSDALAKKAKSTSVINDVIAVTKDGYLNYRVIVTNSDTSGIEIKMIVSAGTVTDADGNVYQTVRIGTQVWTVDNLRTTKYNDNSAIPLITDSAAWVALSTPGYCYYDNTTNADSIKKFGALYNWYVVNTKKLAPMGWHVPTDAEWDTLQNYLIANGYNWDGSITGNMIAKSMAAKTDWITSVDAGGVGNDLTFNNRSGFSAFPGGSRNSIYGYFGYVGSYGNWWSATEVDASDAYYRLLKNVYDFFYRFYFLKRCGFSVRLVRY
jgi:uncharacterized protein (TIGR02145 family)